MARFFLEVDCLRLRVLRVPAAGLICMMNRPFGMMRRPAGKSEANESGLPGAVIGASLLRASYAREC